VAGCLLAPAVIHIAAATGQGTSWTSILVLAEAAVIAWVALGFGPARPFRWGGCIAAMALAAFLCASQPDGLVVAAAIPHALAYLCILAVFAGSLLPGRRPIVTILAEKSRGALAPAIVRYTRRVTIAWCLFCAGQLTVSLFLLLLAPRWAWSLFVNVLNVPLLAAMFCGEFAWRRWRYGSRPQERLTDGFHMTRQMFAARLNEAAGGREGQAAGGAVE
jgi:uncharacterized membrane protein